MALVANEKMQFQRGLLETFQEGVKLLKHPTEPSMPVVEPFLINTCSSATSSELLSQECAHPHADVLGVPSWADVSILLTDRQLFDVNSMFDECPFFELIYSVADLGVNGLGITGCACGPIDSSEGLVVPRNNTEFNSFMEGANMSKVLVVLHYGACQDGYRHSCLKR